MPPQTMSDNAIDVLMNHARNNSSRKRPLPLFECPLGCGEHVTEVSVNLHIDKCIGSSDSKTCSIDAGSNTKQLSANDGKSGTSSVGIDTDNDVGYDVKPQPTKRKCNDSVNAFSHMMKRSATVFSKDDTTNNAIRHRFHLHNTEGLVTWNCIDDDSDCSTDDEVDCGGVWSATALMKKVQVIHLGEEQSSSSPNQKRGGDSSTDDKVLELTISSSVPPYPQDKKRWRLVRMHSRLSVSHLKSCLQKSMRRRAPLPAVRVAMELADRSWGDLIRR